VNLFASRQDEFTNIHVDTLFDKQATSENFLKLKSQLMKSKVDDEVIVFISGHGLLDDSLDFYFATYDCDFSHPERRGVSYDALEDLLDGIPARKKLLLIDACHSGEVDKEELVPSRSTDITLSDGTKGDLKVYSYRGAHTEDKGHLGLSNSFGLMQELFANLSRGSGAVVISAAAGKGYALESQKWNNGVFTYSILDGIRNKKADLNGDGIITVTELKDYVSKEVERLTNGKQKPTSRRENLEYDFKVH